jgi:hypothetical protein
MLAYEIHKLDNYNRKGRGAQAEQSDRMCQAYKHYSIAKRAFHLSCTKIVVETYSC